MSQLTGPTLIEAQSLYESNAVPSHALGQIGVTGDGRKFRYVKAGGTALVVGNVLQSAATDTNYSSMAVQAAVSAGATSIPVTLGGTAVTANQFDGGYLVVSKVTGIGQSFQIKSHTVQTDTTGTCTFEVDHAVTTALTTSSTVTIVKNLYDAVIVAPTTSTGKRVGGAIFATVAGEYGWIQSGGLGFALGDATASAAAAQALSPSTTTAGTVTKAVTLDERVGTSIYVASVSAEVQPIHWEID